MRSRHEQPTEPLALPQRALLPRPLPPPARRPTLVLVEEEELRAPLAAQLAPMRAPASTWLVASVVAAVAIAAGVGVAWLWSRPAEVAQVPAAVATTTLNAATVAARPVAASGAAPVAAAVPELDVNSLPAAPPSSGRGR